MLYKSIYIRWVLVNYYFRVNWLCPGGTLQYDQGLLSSPKAMSHNAKDIVILRFSKHSLV